MRRGEVWLVNLDPTIGAEIKKTRPAVIVNDDAVGILPLKVIVPITEWHDRFIEQWLTAVEAGVSDSQRRESPFRRRVGRAGASLGS